MGKNSKLKEIKWYIVVIVVLVLATVIELFLLNKNNHNDTDTFYLYCDDKTNCKEKLNGITVEYKELEDKLTLLINGKDVSKKVNASNCKITVISDLLLADCDSSKLVILNSSGEELYTFDSFDNNYFYDYYTLSNNDDESLFEIKVVTSINKDDKYITIDGKSLDKMNCKELKKHKDMKAQVSYKVDYLGKKEFSKVEVLEEKETLENYKEIYKDLLKSCKKNK